MMLPRTADVVIVGAGVIGSAIAYYLTRKNIRAVILERTPGGSGSSVACEGLVLLQSKKPGLHLEMALASLKLFENLSDELGLDVEFEKKGGLVVMETPQELEVMRPFVEKQKASGVEIEFLDRAQTLEAEPSLSPDIAGASYSPRDSLANPLLLNLAFLKSAVNRGARLFPGIEATGLEVVRGAVRAVNTSSGRIETPLVINSAGVAAPKLMAGLGFDLQIEPRRGQILVTEAVKPLLRLCLLSAKYIAAKFDPEIAKSGGLGFAVEQTANGNILIGSTREFVGFDNQTTWTGLQHIAANIIRIIPPLENLFVIRTFAGLRPYTPDGLPILGPVPQVRGLVIAAGHEGDGVTLAPITGQMIADFVSQAEPAFPLEPFRPDRFKEKSE